MVAFSCIQVVYCQDGVFVHTAVPTATQFANIIPGKVTVVEKVRLTYKNTQNSGSQKIMELRWIQNAQNCTEKNSGNVD